MSKTIETQATQARMKKLMAVLKGAVSGSRSVGKSMLHRQLKRLIVVVFVFQVGLWWVLG